MFTRDRFQTDPNGSCPESGPDRPSVYTGPFWNGFGMGPNGSKTGPVFCLFVFCCVFCSSSFGSVRIRKHLDRFQTVPCKQKPIQTGSNGSGPIPCKHSLRIRAMEACQLEAWYWTVFRTNCFSLYFHFSSSSRKQCWIEWFICWAEDTWWLWSATLTAVWRNKTRTTHS